VSRVGDVLGGVTVLVLGFSRRGRNHARLLVVFVVNRL
jgi:hypothetical protein